jgi:16S rRNA (guanine527-N7)-methyltransferase
MTSRDFRDRLLRRARAVNLPISPSTIDALEVYYRLLARWNARINLTALPLDDLRDTAMDRLLIEPLAAAVHVPPTALGWYDLGSGGGSPAIPLKLVRPTATLTMVEAKARKAAFLREAIRTLELRDTRALNIRFETLDAPPLRATAQLVTVRAVKPDEALFSCAASLLTPGGQLLLFSSESAAPAVAAPPAFEVGQTAKASATPGSVVRILHRR